VEIIARYSFEIVIVGLVDIELQQELGLVVRRFTSLSESTPSRQRVVETSGPRAIEDFFDESVAVVKIMQSADSV
jgi:hypothetical protein